MPYLAVLWSALATWLLIAFLLRSRLAHSFADHPNERSLHQRAVPRLGGLAMMVGLFSSLGWQAELPWWIGGPWVLLVAVSLLDDWCDLSVGLRFFVHLLAATAFLCGTGLCTAPFLALPLLLLIVWMCNLYNFMDGADGLAGGMTLFGFAAYALAALAQGDMMLAEFSLSISAAALAFLCFNFAPARIFMGDAGSIPLGFLAAALGIWGWQRGLWPFWFPGLVFSPFVLDATVTLFKRALRGEKVWQAHREHYYQRLVRLGWGHRNTALLEYGLMLAATLLALYLLHVPERWGTLLSAWLLLCAGLMLWLEWLWIKRRQA